MNIPQKAYNGYWWAVPAMVMVECPSCGAMTFIRPAVMRYIEVRDFGDEHKRFEPEWARRGWRAQYVCDACNYFGWKQHDNNYVTTRDIKQWIADFQEWFQSFQWAA